MMTAEGRHPALYIFVVYEKLSERCQSTSSMSFSVKVLQLKVSSHRCIPKPSVSCSAAVHHCHPFHLLFSPFSAPSLSSLASVSEWCSSAWRQTSREWLQPLLLCVLSFHSPHPSPDRRLRKRHLSSSFAAPCRTLLLLSGVRLTLQLFVGNGAFFFLLYMWWSESTPRLHIRKRKITLSLQFQSDF